MRLLTVLRLGFHRAHRHRGLVLLAYLVSMLPALLMLSAASGTLAPSLDSSLFAGRLLQGDSWSVWMDFATSEANHLGPVQTALPVRLLLGILIQILFAAGVVEVLLERDARAEHPLLLGVGRHGIRFVRSALLFLLPLGATVALTRLVAVAIAAVDRGDDRWTLLGWLAAGCVGLLLYGLMDLAYDLSRIAAAAHFEGRMMVGWLKALGFTLRRPWLLLLWLILAVLQVGPLAGYVLAREAWAIADVGRVLVLLAVQQALFLLRAYFQISLWGCEVALYQGIGEPRWCGGVPLLRRRRSRRLTGARLGSPAPAPPSTTATGSTP